MTTVAAQPRWPAANATPWAWLPALAATTPRARSASESREILLKAPRTLNEPVRCRFSHFRKTGPAKASESTREWSTGVSEITSWTIFRCAVTSSGLTPPGVVATEEVCHSFAGPAPPTRTAADAKTRDYDILSNGAAIQPASPGKHASPRHPRRVARR